MHPCLCPLHPRHMVVHTVLVTPAVKIKHFDPSMFDFGKKKAFPMRPGHFFASCEKAMTDLDWTPEFGTVDGLRDSYENDFVHKKVRMNDYALRGRGGRGGADTCLAKLTRGSGMMDRSLVFPKLSTGSLARKLYRSTSLGDFEECSVLVSRLGKLQQCACLAALHYTFWQKLTPSIPARGEF